MRHDEAMQLASGYAWGCEDTAGLPTRATAENPSGSYAFALAFAAGWDEYNSERRGMMTNVRSAYERWQATSGATIWEAGTRPAKPRTCTVTASATGQVDAWTS
jgi:hypothetical protein